MIMSDGKCWRITMEPTTLGELPTIGEDRLTPAQALMPVAIRNAARTMICLDAHLKRGAFFCRMSCASAP